MPKAKPVAPKAPKAVAKVEVAFPAGPTTVEEAEHYTTVLMNYLVKHPELSISETASL
jgi:hypothetical protein